MEVLAIHNTPEEVQVKTATIYETMLRTSRQMREGNFTVIGVDDLSCVFRLYDRHIFGGWLEKEVARKADGPLTFRLSSTMTCAGGKTTKTRCSGPDGNWMTHYGIAIASRLLFMTFDEVQRPVEVCGLICGDRLHALQRIMEHEIVHLVELMVWGESSCAAPRFKTLVENIFGHRSVKHDLVTPTEAAAARHDVKPGSIVEFEFEGIRLAGRVNRIHHRATVLVETADGMQYSDGKRYKKFYVPLPALRVLPIKHKASVTKMVVA